MVAVTYAINADFGRSGTGYTASKACAALHETGMLKAVLCRSHAPTTVPDALVHDVFPGGRGVSRAISAISYYGGGFFPSQYVNDRLFDRGASKHVGGCDVFAAWNVPLRSHATAKAAGAVTIKEAGSSHPLTRKAIVDAELRRRGVRLTHDGRMAALEMREIALVDHVVVPSTFVKESYIAQGVSADKVHVVPCGVDVVHYEATPLPDGPFTVLFWGQVQHRKGVLDLLDAWDKAALQDARLVFIGRVFPDARAALASLRGRADIEVHGFVPDPRVFVKQAHLLAFPSLEDGFALVVTEAMACGRPALITGSVGAKDVLRDGKEGFVVGAGDVDAIAASLRGAYDNRQALQRMGRAARRRVEPYTWNEYGDAIISLYKRVAR